MRVESRVTSVSWIPSEAVTGLMKSAFSGGISHYDDPPPARLGDLEEMRDADRFRFANRLAVWAEFDGGQARDHGASGGVVMGTTRVALGPLGTSFAAIALPDLRGEPEVGDGWVRYTQTVGGRTAMPCPRRIASPPFVRMQSPLVWTTLSITLHADGTFESDLVGASPFPRHWVYDAGDALILKAGTTDFQGWVGQEGRHRTPWGDEDSPVVVTAAETALERQLSATIMRGGHRPTVRTVSAGEVVVKQGSEEHDLMLLLDGVLAVDVDGEQLPELGPGAVIGERAVLEGGRRTATLTASTPVRLAQVPPEHIDRELLARLAEVHKREQA